MQFPPGWEVGPNMRLLAQLTTTNDLRHSPAASTAATRPPIMPRARVRSQSLGPPYSHGGCAMTTTPQKEHRQPAGGRGRQSWLCGPGSQTNKSRLFMHRPSGQKTIPPLISHRFQPVQTCAAINQHSPMLPFHPSGSRSRR